MTQDPRLPVPERVRAGRDGSSAHALEPGNALAGKGREARPDGPTIVALAKARRRRGRIIKLVLGVLVLGAVAFFLVRRAQQSGEPGYRFATVPTRRGDLREVVTATGTLKGQDSVDIGAVISGRIAEVRVDVNDEVAENQVLAEIDPTQLKSRVEQSRAQVRAADASVQQARATAAQAKAELARITDLEQKGLASTQQLETATADAARGAANVASAEAQATLSRATLKDAETQLSYAIIRSPMPGIVLARLVEPGQTVASSLQAPVMFTIARDLKQLELRVEIDEADVGRVQKGQEATFTVDAWPSQVFSSRVLNVHNLPTAGQTVVTYQAVLSVNNEDLRLKPGMTATASIITSQKKSVLLVPNAALRFTPPAAPAATSAPALPFFGMPGRGFGGGRARAPQKSSDPTQQTLWVLQADAPVPVSVEVGGTDGENTEVVRVVSGQGGARGSQRRRAGEAGASSAERAGGESGSAEPAPAPPKFEEGTPVIVDVDQKKSSS